MMNNAEFQLRGVVDPRLAVHATSALPAWLWSTDGARILWANPVAAKLFGAANGAALANRTFGAADPRRRQVAQLAGRLPLSGAIRLERLRGFGAPLGQFVTCGCARLEFADADRGIVVAAAEPLGRTMPLAERLQRLVDGTDMPIAAFARDGMFVGASDAARPRLGFRNLSEPGLDGARREALARGRAEMPIGTGHIVLHRLGSGADIGLVALIDEFAEPAAQTITEPTGADVPPKPDESSPDVEGVADAPAAPADAAPARLEASASPPPWLDPHAPYARRHPLRFMWQMDAERRFSLGSDEFTRLIGARTAAGFGRLWCEIADTFGLDPDGRVLKAVATGGTWSGITLNWPVDGSDGLPVELSGLPVYDRKRNFAGYRGFGVCRDLDGLTRLAALRRYELLNDEPARQTLAADIVRTVPAAAAEPVADFNAAACNVAEASEPVAAETSQPTGLEVEAQMPENVVPFRAAGEPKSPALTPVENSAFNELARQLAARLENENGTAASAPVDSDSPGSLEPQRQDVNAQPEWLVQPEPPARGETRRDRALLDLLPVGVLIYRLDRLLYANPAFLAAIGYPSLQALEEAGGLDALYVEPGVSGASSTSDTGTPVTISTGQTAPMPAAAAASDARLYTIAWDDDSALALIFTGACAESAAAAAATSETTPASVPSTVGHANAEELGAILDTTAEGIVMFDAEGNINSCNRSAEALFGYDGEELVRRNLADLFAPESQRAVMHYLASINGAGLASLLEHGREALGRVREGGLIPLSMTMGRTRPDGPNFFAVFRDLSHARKSESELGEARRLADRAADARAGMLARISHEVRAPLNAIVGFAEVMIGERFGALGNQRYLEYMKDIRASGERVMAIISDLLDLSRIETGKLELAFASQNLNELVEHCVAAMQPQANRERIIIRTSLAQALPPVLADARALRQIMLNLIGNSIHLANPGGQVIVSTALSDLGAVTLRVRDTGHGLDDNEVAAAMEPFRSQAPPDRASHSGVGLSLTKALVEANRAEFHVRSGPRAGTLIEVVFSQAMARV